MSLKLREENQVLLSFENLMDDDSVVSDELSFLASNIRKEVINVLDSFLSFLKVYDERKVHNMISLMLDLRYKNLRVVSSFVGREQNVVLVEKYDRKSLYLMLVKCHEHLHPLVRSEKNSTNHNIFDEDYNLDIFENIASASEPNEIIVKRELLIFRRYQLDVMDIKYPFQWWQKHEAMFFTIEFLA
jgi:hypothetical protein